MKGKKLHLGSGGLGEKRERYLVYWWVTLALQLTSLREEREEGKVSAVGQSFPLRASLGC